MKRPHLASVVVVAVFGSVARGEAGPDSDIDLLVTPPRGATLEDMSRLRDTIERLLGRPVDVVSYGGLKSGTKEAVRHRLSREGSEA